MTLLQLTYISRATERFSARDLPELVAAAQEHNDTIGITGALYFANGRFIQVLEGDEIAVLTLYAAIVDDPRHTEVETVARRIVTERCFGEWRMGKLPDGLAVRAAREAFRVSRTPGAMWGDAEVDAILDEFRARLVTAGS